MDFCAGAGGEGHRNETEAGHEGSHEDGTQAREAALLDGDVDLLSFGAQGIDEGEHHEAIQDGDAGEGDEADAGRDGERNVAQPERGDTAGEGEGHAGEDEEGVFDSIQQPAFPC